MAAIPRLRVHRQVLAYALGFALLASGAARADEPVRFEIPSQPLVSALRAFTTQSKMQLLYEQDAVRHVMANAVVGNFEKREALKKLLQGTGVEIVFSGDNAATIRVTPKTSASNESISNQVQLAQVASPETGEDRDEVNQNPQEVTRSEGNSSVTSSEVTEMDTIVVTGSHIRGTEPVSRVSVYTHEDFELAGIASLKDFFQTLPQNFSTSSEVTINAVVSLGEGSNSVDANGVNLRGFGSGSTLVLLNGNRIAPGNHLGNIIDISTIPMSSIERIEMIADGASAIYGSDAVGGVINLILRDYPVTETFARYGSDSHSARQQYQAGQSVGVGWDTGSILASYEFDKQTPLYASDRPFTDNAVEPFTLLPQSRRDSVFIAAQQDTLHNWRLFANGLYSSRKGFNSATVDNVFSQQTSYEIDTRSAALGANKGFGAHANLQLDSNYSRSATNNRAFYDAGNTGTNFFTSRDLRAVTEVLSVGAKLDGSLGAWSSDAVRYAFGVQSRRETFSRDNLLSTNSPFEPSRKVRAVFAELRIPLLSTLNVSGLGRLEVSLADRYERYSDFGNTNNPEVGIIWQPGDRFKVRAKYSTSFVAPILYDLNPTPGTIFGMSSDYNTENGLYSANPPNVILVQGGNPDLGAQKSKNWSVGIEWVRSGTHGFDAYLNYFNLSYRDQIRSISDLGFNAIIFSQDILSADAILGPNIINHNPSQELVQQFTRQPTYQEFGGPFNPASGIVLIDARQQNLAVSKTNGWDFGVSYSTMSSLGDIRLGIDGVYIMDYDNQISAAAPKVSFLNLPYNPIDLKLRAMASFSRKHMSLAAFVNYTDSYESRTSGKERPVASWLTVDANITYDLSGLEGFFSGSSLSLGASNIFDRSPPYVLNHAGFPLSYDGVNANPLGRFIHIQFTKRWGKS